MNAERDRGGEGIGTGRNRAGGTGGGKKEKGRENWKREEANKGVD